MLKLRSKTQRHALKEHELGDLTTNFSKREFACPCGCKADNISPWLVQSLQDVRDEIEIPMRITSGVRCEMHNAAVGGKAHSAHVPVAQNDEHGVVGRAVDISCKASRDRHILLGVLYRHFGRIGLGHDFIHVDQDETKPDNVTWHYYAGE